MYKYPIEECDVDDKDQLRKFREKRAEWLTWLNGKDPHSIWPQISTLLWNAVLFHTVNDLRREARESPSADVGFNGAVIRLFDAGFVSTQATAIRRLTDEKDNRPERDVISLRRVIADIKANRGLITREVYVAYDGLPYDPKPAYQDWSERGLASGKTDWVEFLPMEGLEAWGASDLVHKNFDKLARTKPEQRSRNDRISIDWLNWLNRKLDVCEDIRKFTDKFIAHAADSFSRTGLTNTQTGVTLDRLARCQKAIYQVAAFLHGPLLYEGTFGPVPVPQYDHLQNLEKGWVAKGSENKAHEFWNKNFDSIQRWESEPHWSDQEDSPSPPIP